MSPYDARPTRTQQTQHVNTSYSGIGVFGFTFLILLLCKIFQLGLPATWPWWVITAPLWGPLTILTGVLFVIGIIAIIGMLLKAWVERE